MRPSSSGQQQLRPSSSQIGGGRPHSRGGGSQYGAGMSTSRSTQFHPAGAESRNYGHSWERSNAKFAHVPAHADKHAPPVVPPQESSYARTVADTFKPGALSLVGALAKGAPVSSRLGSSAALMQRPGSSAALMQRPSSRAQLRPASTQQRPASRAQQRAAASVRSDIQSVRDLR
jgi:hypothetical protein